MASSHHFSKTASKKPPDRAEPMQLSTPVAKKLDQEQEKEQERKKYLEYMQTRSRSNINRILETIDTELESVLNRDNQDLLSILLQQKEVFLGILAYKQTGQKSSLITAKKEPVQAQIQLQSQIESLEKSVENKFSQILTSIETRYQDLSQNMVQKQAFNQAAKQAANQATNQAANQAANQASNQAPSQAPSQAKTYAQRAASNIQPAEQKKQQKELDKAKYREKRLIIQVDKKVAESFDSYNLRNQINDKFFEKENLSQPVIATATKSFTSQSIILTTMPEFSADFLLQKKAVWEDIFSNIAQKIEKDSHWSKIVIHGVPIKPFSMDDGLSILKEEIETYNPGLKLLKTPIWLSSQENRQIKRHASVLIAVENAEQAQLALEKKLCIAGNWLIAEKCKQNNQQSQCQNCQKYGHSTRACLLQANCQICAEKHKTSQHNCNICNIQGKSCPHAALKCSNCGDNHMANSNICAFKKNPEKRDYRFAKNLQKSQQQQQANSNPFCVLIDNTDRY